MSTASSLQLPLQRRALLTLQLALVLASSLQGTATGPSSEFAAEVESNISALSAECSPRLSPLRAPGTDFHCQLRWGSGGPSKAADAFGIFEDTIAETSWATLRIHGLPRRAESESDGMSDQRMSFAAGFVEGALTVERTWQHRLSYFGATFAEKAIAFVEANDAYVRERIAANSELEPFWAEVKLVWAQLDGLVAGHLAACKPGRCLDRRSFLLLNAEEDLSNIIHKPFKGALEGWTAEEAAEYTRKTTHCSAIVRLLPGNSDLLLGHNTWTGYYSMLRVLKEIDLPLFGARAADSVFPGYFGALYSGDDFYALSSGLAVQETTNSVYNSSTLALISPSSVLTWVRTLVANRKADSGPSWARWFSPENSGTINNQWMVLHLRLFQPGVPPLNGTLIVLEQMPGKIVWADESESLRSRGWSQATTTWNAVSVPLIHTTRIPVPKYFGATHRRPRMQKGFGGCCVTTTGSTTHCQLLAMQALTSLGVQRMPSLHATTSCHGIPPNDEVPSVTPMPSCARQKNAWLCGFRL
ncbi:unnamed protein product [Polarella glacialis]|uniref:Phospholipase B-like n=1 Tax=Polarella glacialis TaxID=89957 RepID=A0A813DPN6_POLGL|nr:unnamed protein product [Polarella glacialis]